MKNSSQRSKEKRAEEGSTFLWIREKLKARGIKAVSEMKEQIAGLTQEGWCRNHNIPYSTLRYWLRKLRKESETEERETNWLKVDLSTGGEIATVCVPEASNHIGSINIRLDEFSVEFQRGIDFQQVFEVLRMLKTL